MARYPDYAALPQHIQAILRAVTADDAAAERYYNTPNKLLDGKALSEIINAPLGQRAAEHFLMELAGYLAVDDEELERFKASLGKKR
ncbi:MAG: hypothetical protein O7C98_01185 [Planctomycetota bacterium]|nr:hypothetical protein [Planctomycetota bacterium]